MESDGFHGFHWHSSHEEWEALVHPRASAEVAAAGAGGASSGLAIASNVNIAYITYTKWI